MKRVITRNIGNLKGFSTDSIFIRPPNVADRALNIQLAPDGTLQARRGYQCQAARIGGMGIGTFDNPALNTVETVCVGTDGFVYKKLTRQLFLDYDGRVTGDITGVTNAAPAVITSVGHNLQTGAEVIIRNVGGTFSINDQTFAVTVINANSFSLDGSDTSTDPAYTTGGTWSIAFADMRYLTMSIYTDPEFIYSNAGQSITCDVVVNRAAQVNGTQTGVTSITVDYGHELNIGDAITFTNSSGATVEKTLTGVTATTVSFAAPAVTVSNNTYINQSFTILFGKGFDTASPYTIADFIAELTDVTNGVYGLDAYVNGLDDLPAAFLQIFEETIIPSQTNLRLDYWYWEAINTPVNPPLPGSADIDYQNSDDFENASIVPFDDVVYIANGWDYPQKYDGQNVYRTGMPEGVRPSEADNAGVLSEPFVTGNTFQYATTYEQVDNLGHIVEGAISEVRNHSVVAANAAIDVTMTPLQSLGSNNWNTNAARAAVGSSTVYGPDENSYYYHRVTVTAGYTLKIGDTAYYADTQGAVMTGGLATSVIILPVNSGHDIVAGDVIFFLDSTAVTKRRTVVSVTSTTITIDGSPVTINPGLGAAYANVLVYDLSRVYGNVAIVNGGQSDVTTITVDAGHTIQIGDFVTFTDVDDNLQRREVTNIAATTITITGPGVLVADNLLLSAEEQSATEITLQSLKIDPMTFTADSPISNNLKINIYRTKQGESFGTNGELYWIAAVPNDSLVGTQTYTDSLADAEIISREFDNPVNTPSPPPISKYLLAFGNQMFYAGGERGNPENSDNVFFSEGNDPENTPLATNFFSVPNKDDDVTGIGISGSTLITTKDQSLWGITGNFLDSQIEVMQIAPGTNIGCVAHASIASVGGLMYFLSNNGVYALTESQLFPTDPFGNPVPISSPIDAIFRETQFLPYKRFVPKRAVAINYTQDNQYLIFLPCEDVQSTIRTANSSSVILCYDYKEKNWFLWNNMNAAGGMVVVDSDLYFQERRFSGVNGNTANLYKQHRFYRLIDHADHAGPQYIEWRSSWEDLGQPEVRKKFCRCVLLMDRLSELYQTNNPEMTFSSYVNRIPDLQSTIATVRQRLQTRETNWAETPWSWNYWSGYQDSFITINLKQGTVAKSMQVGFTMQGIDQDFRLAGYQLEIIPENRLTVVR